MSWAPGRDEVLAMLDRHDLEIVIASMDLATALLTQSDEAIATASDAAVAQFSGAMGTSAPRAADAQHP